MWTWVWTWVPDVLVRGLWLPGATRAELRVAVEEYAGPTTRLCPACASSAHGRPRGAAGEVLSLSYTTDLVVLARVAADVTSVAGVAVGVDVERVTGRPLPDGIADLRAWTLAEAVLKASGEGLHRDPATVRPDEAWTAALPLPPGWVGTVAVLPEQSAHEPFEPRLSWAARGAPPRAARA